MAIEIQVSTKSADDAVTGLGQKIEGLAGVAKTAMEGISREFNNNPFGELLKSLNPLNESIRALDSTLKSFNTALSDQAVQAKAVTEVHRVLGQSTKHLRTETSELIKTLHEEAKAARQVEDADRRLESIKQKLLTATERQAKVTAELQAYRKTDSVIAAQYNRAMELMKVNVTGVGTAQERHLAVLKEQVGALNKSKAQLFDMMGTYHQLSQAEKDQANSLQQTLDAWKLMGSYTKQAATPAQEYATKQTALNKLFKEGVIDANELAVGLSRLDKETREAGLAAQASTSQYKAMQEALQRTERLTREILTPAQQYERTLRDLQVVLREKGPEAYARGLDALERETREAGLAAQASTDQFKRHAAALKEAEGVIRSSLSPLDVLRQQIARLSSEIGHTPTEAKKLADALDILRKKEAELVRTLSNNSAQDKSVKTLRERLSVMRDMNMVLPRTVEQQAALQKGWQGLTAAEQKEYIALSKVAEAEKHLSNEMKKSLTPMEQYRKKLESIALLERQFVATGGRRGIGSALAGNLRGGALKDLIALEVSALKATTSLGRLTGGLNLVNQATAAGRAAMIGAGQSFGIFTGSTIAAAAAAYGLAKAIRSSLTLGADFELQFTKIALLMADVSDSFDTAALVISRQAQAVKNEILTLATESEHGLESVAKGAEVLARSGSDAAAIISNLSGVMELATVGSLEVEDAANIATSALAAFSNESQGLSHYVDILAFVANKTKASVDDLGQSLKYVGPIANQIRLSFDETAIALGALAEAGIRGSQAGTTLRRVLLSLQVPTDRAKAVLDKYGASFSQANMEQGKFIEQLEKLGQASIAELRSLTAITALPGLVALTTENLTLKMRDMVGSLASVAGYAERITAEIRKTVSVRWDNLVDTVRATVIGAFDEFGPRLSKMLERFDKWVTDNSPLISRTISNLVDGFLNLIEFTEKWGSTLWEIAKTFATYKIAATVLSGMVTTVTALASAWKIAKTAYDGYRMSAGMASGAAVGGVLVAGAGRGSLEREAAMMARQIPGAAAPAAVAVGGLAKSMSALRTAMSSVLAAGRGLLAFLGGWAGAIITLGSVLASVLIPRLFESNNAVEFSARGIAKYTESVEEAEAAIRGLTAARLDAQTKQAGIVARGAEEEIRRLQQAIRLREEAIQTEEERIQSLVKSREMYERLAEQPEIDSGGRLTYYLTLEEIDKALIESGQELSKLRQQEIDQTTRLTEVQDILARSRAASLAGQEKQAHLIWEWFESIQNEGPPSQEVIAELDQKLVELFRLDPQNSPLLGGLEGFFQMISNFRGVSNIQREIDTFRGLSTSPSQDVWEDAELRAARIDELSEALERHRNRQLLSNEALLQVVPATKDVDAAHRVVLNTLQRQIDALTTYGQTLTDTPKQARDLIDFLEKQKGSFEQTASSLEKINTLWNQVDTGKAASQLRELGISAEQANARLKSAAKDDVVTLLGQQLSKVDSRFKDFGKAVDASTSRMLDHNEAVAEARDVLVALEKQKPGVLSMLGGIEKVLEDLVPALSDVVDGKAALTEQIKTLTEEGIKMYSTLMQADSFEELAQGADETQRGFIALAMGGSELSEALKKVLTPTEKLEVLQTLLNVAVEAFPELAGRAADASRRLGLAVKGSAENLANEAQLLKLQISMLGASEKSLWMLARAQEQFGEDHQEIVKHLSDPAWLNMQDPVYELTKALEDGKAARDAWSSFADDLASAFLEGTESVKSYFKSMLRDLQKQLLSSAIWSLIQRLFGGATSGSFSSLFSQAFASRSQGSIWGGFGSLLQSTGGSGGSGGNVLSALSQVISSGVSGGLMSLGGGLAGMGMGALGSGIGWTGAHIGGGLLSGLGSGLSAGMGNLLGGNTLFGIGQMLPAIAAIAAVAAVIQKISGGKLFGTSYSPESATQTLSLADGGYAGLSLTEVRQRSLFRGRKWRTTSQDPGDEARQAAEELYDAVAGSMIAAAQQLASDVPAMIDGAIRTISQYDKKGNVTATRILVDVIGRTWEEATAELAASRLGAEAIIATIDAALGTTVDALVGGILDGIDDGLTGSGGGPRLGEEIGREIGDLIPKTLGAGRQVGEASAIAERWRHDAELLAQGAQFLLLAATDIRRGVGLLGDGSLTQIADLIEELAITGETLSDTYMRVAASAALLDQALALSGVSIDGTREALVRLAVDITEAAGGLDRATSLWTTYFDNYYSATELALYQLNQLLSQGSKEFVDIGLNLSDFRGAEGMSALRALFEEQLPTLSAEAVVQWLEALGVLAAVEAAQESYNQTLAEGEVAIRDAAAIATLIADLQWDDLLAGMSELDASIARTRRTFADHVAEATALGATEEELVVIRELEANAVQRLIDADLAAQLQAAAAAAEALDKALRSYADIVAGIDEQIASMGRSDYQSTLAGIARTLRSNIDSLNEAARAAGLQTAREEDLGRAHLLAAMQAAQALEQLREAGRQQAEALYGSDLSDIEAQISELESASSSFSGALDAVTDSISDAANLLWGDFSPLKDADRLPLAMQALAAGEASAEDVLRIAQRLYASGSDYNRVFAQVQEIVGTLAGASGGGSPGANPYTAQIEALKTERDALLAEQSGVERYGQARSLAQTIADIMGSTSDSAEAVLQSLIGDRATLTDLMTDLRLDSLEALNEYLASLQASDYSVSNMVEMLRTEFDYLLEGMRQIFLPESQTLDYYPVEGDKPDFGSPEEVDAYAESESFEDDETESTVVTLMRQLMTRVETIEQHVAATADNTASTADSTAETVAELERGREDEAQRWAQRQADRPRSVRVRDPRDG